MSIHAISWVLKYSESRLGARLVLIVIADHAKEDGTGAWPAVATIAKESRLTTREVQYALRELEEIGELRTEIAEGPRGTNLYYLLKMPGGEKFSQALDSAGGGAKERRGALGSVRTVLEPSLEPSKRVAELPVLGEELDPKILREKVEQLERAKDEKRFKKANRAAGNFQRPVVRQNVTPPKIVTNKQPESWIWFSTAFKRLADANAFCRADLWPILDGMIAEIGREEIEQRLSIFIDAAEKISSYLAKDFIEGGWRTIDPEEEKMPRIVNED